MLARCPLRGFGSDQKAEEDVKRMMAADIILTTYSALTAGRLDQIGKQASLPQLGQLISEADISQYCFSSTFLVRNFAH
jgi:hypothetical protein